MRRICANQSHNKFLSEIHYLYKKKIIMLSKEKVRKTINKLPDQFTIDELIEQLIFMEKVEEGIMQSEDGKILSNEDVKLIIDKWST